MQELELPHGDFLKFAKKILEKQHGTARVLIEFPKTPSLGMFIEAAAQSCAALNEHEEVQEAYLVALKSIKLHNPVTTKRYEVLLREEFTLEKMIYIKFEVTDKDTKIVDGYLTIAIQ